MSVPKYHGISEREEKARALYELTRNLSSASGIEEVIKISVMAINKHFGIECLFIIQKGLKGNGLQFVNEPGLILSESEQSIATWTFHHSRVAGKYTDTLPSTGYTFYPLKGARLKLG